MKKTTIKSLLYFVSAVLLTTQSAQAENTNPKIVVDIPPTQAILIEHGFVAKNVDVLLEENQSGHHFSLTPKQIEKLSSADVIFGVGSPFMPEIVEAAKNANPDGVIAFYFDNFIESDYDSIGLERLDACDLEEARADIELPLDNDPHIWLSRTQILQMGDFMDCVMINYTGLARKAKPVIDEGDWGLTNPVKLIASHDAFGYFERENGIESYGAFRDLNDQPLPAKALEDVMKNIEDGHIQCLLVEAGGHSHDIEELAEKEGLKEHEFDILGWAFQSEEWFFDAYYGSLGAIYQDCD